MTISIKTMIPYPDLTNSRLIAHLKHLHPDEPAQAMYGRFVAARDLRPNIDMGAFIAIFDATQPCEQCTYDVVDFHATHITEAGRECMVVGGCDTPGKVNLVFADGGYGSEFLVNLKDVSMVEK